MIKVKPGRHTRLSKESATGTCHKTWHGLGRRADESSGFTDLAVTPSLTCMKRTAVVLSIDLVMLLS